MFSESVVLFYTKIFQLLKLIFEGNQKKSIETIRQMINEGIESTNLKNDILEPNSNSFAVIPSIGFLFNTNFGAVSMNIQRPFMVYGVLAVNEGDLNQRSNVWQLSLALRLKSKSKEK